MNVEVRDIASSLIANVAIAKGSEAVLESISGDAAQSVQKKLSSLSDVSIIPAKPQSPVAKKRPDSSKAKKAETPKVKKVGKVKPVPEPEEKKETHSRRTTAESDPFQQMCIFCGLEDENFNDETLDLHYWKDCPVLTICPHCKMVFQN
jgi:Tfp pilus assembly protein PilP